MTWCDRGLLKQVLTCAFVLLVAATATAQEEVGALYGRVADNDGQALAGVTVTLAGIGAPQVQITDTMGQYRFLGLDPGVYGLRAVLDGFSTLEYPEIDIRAGRNTTMEIVLSAAIDEVITVTAETPLLDERKLAQGSILTQVELEVIPTARDPWSVLSQAPGVLQDRVNVGGNESGNQSLFTAPTAMWSDNTFLVDGVEITDMMATGSSPTYYDFDQFTQFELSTGGTEITKLAPGVSINMVTKRGTNEFRGSARFYVTDAEGYFGVLEQGDPQLDPDELGPGQDEAITGNRTDRIDEVGFEAGGPGWRDRVWLWGSWGQSKIGRFAANGQRDAFQIENTALKLNAQLSSSNSLVASWNNGDKTAGGLGAGPGRAPEATLNQRGPTAIYKLEDTHLFGSSWFLSGTWSKVDGGASFTAVGGVGPTAPEPLLDSDGVLRQNNWSAITRRPSETFKLEGSYFFDSGRSHHELKLGARRRVVEGSSVFSFPGRQLWHIAGENVGQDPGPVDFFFAYRGGDAPIREEFTSLWLQDTLTLGSWTVNAGLRWDLQDGENLPSQVPANPAFPELLPAVDFAGNDGGGLDFETVSPRIGATYAVGEERRTLLRASFARFAQNLESYQHLYRVNPIGDSYAYFLFFDGNDNNMWDSYEVDGDPVFLFPLGFDPANPASAESANRNAPGLVPETTDEAMVAVEHSVVPELMLGLNLTWRRVSNVQEARTIVRDGSGAERLATREDYFLQETLRGQRPDGSPYSADFYSLLPGLTPTGGDLLTNGDRNREYLGATFTLTKRLANQWMARGYLQYGESTWRIPDSFYFYNDPTDDAGAIWTVANTSQDDDGDLYFDNGGRWGALLQSSWAFNVNGMYEVAPERPWGFNVAGNVYGRQGYPLPYYVDYAFGLDGIWRSAEVSDAADRFRLDDIYTLDLRLEKEFAVTGEVGLTFSLDAFNVFNETTVLRRELRINGPRPDYVNETLAPRIFRLAVRVNWR